MTHYIYPTAICQGFKSPNISADRGQLGRKQSHQLQALVERLDQSNQMCY